MINNNLAYVFPGQGSQSVGMLSEIAKQYPEMNDTFSEASDVLGYDMWKLCSEGPKEDLDQTTRTQPALLTAAYALWRIISARTQIKPAMLAGHSLGEFTALVCANALSFSDAVKIVALRGQYMQEAVPAGVGAMAALIGLEEHKINEVCRLAISSPDEVLTPANYNSIGQVVIAGHKEAVMRAINIAPEHGARMALLIPVSVPSHCAMMQPAAEKLAELLSTITFNTPDITVINNANVTAYTDAESIRQALTRQLTSPVRWVETIELFVKSGITQIVECGPGKVLTGLNKRIDKNLQLFTTNDLAGLDQLLKT